MSFLKTKLEPKSSQKQLSACCVSGENQQKPFKPTAGGLKWLISCTSGPIWLEPHSLLKVQLRLGHQYQEQITLSYCSLLQPSDPYLDLMMERVIHVLVYRTERSSFSIMAPKMHKYNVFFTHFPTDLQLTSQCILLCDDINASRIIASTLHVSLHVWPCLFIHKQLIIRRPR